MKTLVMNGVRSVGVSPWIELGSPATVGDHARKHGISGKRPIDSERHGKPSGMSMTASAERGRNRTDICAGYTGAHAEITTSIAIVPDEAEGMVRRESLADLACQDRALHRGNNYALEFDHDSLRREFADQLMLVAKNRSAFLLHRRLRKAIPQVEIKWVGGQSRIDLATSRQGPRP